MTKRKRKEEIVDFEVAKRPHVAYKSAGEVVGEIFDLEKVVYGDVFTELGFSDLPLVFLKKRHVFAEEGGIEERRGEVHDFSVLHDGIVAGEFREFLAGLSSIEESARGEEARKFATHLVDVFFAQVTDLVFDGESNFGQDDEQWRGRFIAIVRERLGEVLRSNDAVLTLQQLFHSFYSALFYSCFDERGEKLPLQERKEAFEKIKTQVDLRNCLGGAVSELDKYTDAISKPVSLHDRIIAFLEQKLAFYCDDKYNLPHIKSGLDWFFAGKKGGDEHYGIISNDLMYNDAVGLMAGVFLGQGNLAVFALVDEIVALVEEAKARLGIDDVMDWKFFEGFEDVKNRSRFDFIRSFDSGALVQIYNMVEEGALKNSESFVKMVNFMKPILQGGRGADIVFDVDEVLDAKQKRGLRLIAEANAHLMASKKVPVWLRNAALKEVGEIDRLEQEAPVWSDFVKGGCKKLVNIPEGECEFLAQRLEQAFFENSKFLSEKLCSPVRLFVEGAGFLHFSRDDKVLEGDYALSLRKALTKGCDLELIKPIVEGLEGSRLKVEFARGSLFREDVADIVKLLNENNVAIDKSKALLMAIYYGDKGLFNAVLGSCQEEELLEIIKGNFRDGDSEFMPFLSLKGVLFFFENVPDSWRRAREELLKLQVDRVSRRIPGTDLDTVVPESMMEDLLFRKNGVSLKSKLEMISNVGAERELYKALDFVLQNDSQSVLRFMNIQEVLFYKEIDAIAVLMQQLKNGSSNESLSERLVSFLKNCIFNMSHMKLDRCDKVSVIDLICDIFRARGVGEKFLSDPVSNARDATSLFEHMFFRTQGKLDLMFGDRVSNRDLFVGAFFSMLRDGDGLKRILEFFAKDFDSAVFLLDALRCCGGDYSEEYLLQGFLGDVFADAFVRGNAKVIDAVYSLCQEKGLNGVLENLAKKDLLDRILFKEGEVSAKRKIELMFGHESPLRDILVDEFVKAMMSDSGGEKVGIFVNELVAQPGAVVAFFENVVRVFVRESSDLVYILENLENLNRKLGFDKDRFLALLSGFLEAEFSQNDLKGFGVISQFIEKRFGCPGVLSILAGDHFAKEGGGSILFERLLFDNKRLGFREAFERVNVIAKTSFDFIAAFNGMLKSSFGAEKLKKAAVAFCRDFDVVERFTAILKRLPKRRVEGFYDLLFAIFSEAVAAPEPDFENIAPLWDFLVESDGFFHKTYAVLRNDFDKSKMEPGFFEFFVKLCQDERSASKEINFSLVEIYTLGLAKSETIILGCDEEIKKIVDLDSGSNCESLRQNLERKKQNAESIVKRIKELMPSDAQKAVEPMDISSDKEEVEFSDTVSSPTKGEFVNRRVLRF